MEKISSGFKNRIIFAILLPVVFIGITIAIISHRLVVEHIKSFFSEQSAGQMVHAVEMAMGVCEERFNDLLDLRLEDNPEMNAASKTAAMVQIDRINRMFPGVRLMVIEKKSKLINTSHDASFDIPRYLAAFTPLEKGSSGIREQVIDEEKMLYHYQYFPFWRWHIVSLMSEKAFLGDLLKIERVVTLGNLGVLFVVLLSVTILFYWRVNLPLKRIISAACGVGRGELSHVPVIRNDEIGQVTTAFNAMVESLERDRRKIGVMMKELRDSEEQYRVVTEDALSLIVLVQNRRFTYLNKGALKTTGYSLEEIIGTDVLDLVHPDDHGLMEKRFRDLESGKLSMDRFECRCRTRGNRTIWIESQATPILLREKNAILIHAVNITDRKMEQEKRLRLEEKLVRAQKMEAIGALAGGVAHDLNNILGGIVGYPELLMMKIPEDSPLRKQLMAIHSSGQKAAAIVQDMLTLARRGVAVSEIMNLNDIIDEYFGSPEFRKLKSHHGNIVFETRLSEDALNVYGSPVHIFKTIMNLVSNAVEAIHDSGTVVVSIDNMLFGGNQNGFETVEGGNYVVVRVSDSGKGIAGKDLSRIYEPFFTKKSMGRSGTGLGMTVVWNTVKDHNGHINVESIEGEGTTFTLLFPATEAPAKEESALFDIDAYMGEGETVLVIDDVEEQREIAEKMLQRLDYRVKTFAGGEKAVEYLENHEASLILLDMIMDPGIDGLETYRRIIEIHPEQKAIIASGFSKTELVREAMKLGVGSYIKKPYTLENIALSVKSELTRC